MSTAPARQSDLASSCREAKRGNVVAAARLRRLANVGSWGAGILPWIRPFVAQLWAALRRVPRDARRVGVRW